MAAKKIGVLAAPHKGGKTLGVATMSQILSGFRPKRDRVDSAMVRAFGGDVDSARQLRLDEAHFGELQT